MLPFHQRETQEAYQNVRFALDSPLILEIDEVRLVLQRYYEIVDLGIEINAPPDLKLDLNNTPLEELPIDREQLVHHRTGPTGGRLPNDKF